MGIEMRIMTLDYSVSQPICGSGTRLDEKWHTVPAGPAALPLCSLRPREISVTLLPECSLLC